MNLWARTLASKIGYKPKYLILQYAGCVDIKKTQFSIATNAFELEIHY